jgi:hypothetical protein
MSAQNIIDLALLYIRGVKMTISTNSFRVEWDDKNKREVEEAKKIYQAAKSEGRQIRSLEDNSLITVFRPCLLGFLISDLELQDEQFSFRIIDDTGDRRLVWELTDAQQVLEASEIFNTYIDKGWRAYAVDALGNKRLRIRNFDAKREEILFEEIKVPKLLDEFVSKFASNSNVENVTKTSKLANFIKSFNRTILVPKTFPG